MEFFIQSKCAGANALTVMLQRIAMLLRIAMYCAQGAICIIANLPADCSALVFDQRPRALWPSHVHVVDAGRVHRQVPPLHELLEGLNVRLPVTWRREQNRKGGTHSQNAQVKV